jgi:hypothetical protein
VLGSTLCLAACIGPQLETNSEAVSDDDAVVVDRTSAPGESVVVEGRTRPILGKLRTRDHEVAVVGSGSDSGQTGFVFVVRANASGTEQVLSSAQFEARFPRLFRHYNASFAENAPTSVIDAGL